MKQLILIVMGLLVLMVAVAVPVVANFSRSTADCPSRMVIVKSPRGEPLECVCIEGTLASCFRPGP